MLYAKSDLLVSPEWLHEHRGDPDLVIVDCPMAEGSYNRAHIPGALKLPVHPYIKAKDTSGNITLHLQGPDEFRGLMAELGIGPNTCVVLYDERGSILATRLWWVLRYYGHENSKVLNGGWQGWVSSGLPVSFRTSEASDRVEPFSPSRNPDRLATLEQIRRNYKAQNWRIFDVRSDDEYIGKDHHGNKRAGHIPDSIHLEWNRFLENSNDTEDVRCFRPAEEIQELLEEYRIDKNQTIATLCQSGIRASLVAFALELVGYPEIKLYDGSMAEWANLDDTPLE
ncbi:MAG: sulfurtransferase [Thermodesulfobacteriota bacterium]